MKQADKISTIKAQMEQYVNTLDSSTNALHEAAKDLKEIYAVTQLTPEQFAEIEPSQLRVIERIICKYSLTNSFIQKACRI